MKKSAFSLLLFVFSLNAQAIVAGFTPPLGHPLSRGTVFLVGNLANGGQGTCSGILISSNLVLTAAHCIPSYVVTGEVIFVPVARVPNETYRRKVLFWKTNHLRDSGTVMALGWENDIALLRFEGHAPLGSVPFVLPQRDWNPQTPIFVSGFGSTGDGDGKGIGVFRISTYPQRSLLSGTGDLLIKMDQAVTGICGGDSGGPPQYF